MGQIKTLFLSELKKLLHYETPEACKVILQKRRNYSFPHMWEEYDRKNKHILIVSNPRFRKKIATLYNRNQTRKSLVGLIRIAPGDFLTYGYVDKRRRIVTVVYQIEEISEVEVRDKDGIRVNTHFATKLCLYAKNETEIIKYDIPTIQRAVYILSSLPPSIIPWSIPWKNYNGKLIKYGEVNADVNSVPVKTVLTVDELYSELKKFVPKGHQLLVATTYVIQDDIPVLYLHPLKNIIQDFVIYEKRIEDLERQLLSKEITEDNFELEVDKLYAEFDENLKYVDAAFKIFMNHINIEADWFLSIKTESPDKLIGKINKLVEKNGGENSKGVYSMLRLFRW